MSIQYCDYCNRHIDTDFDAEHFDCADVYQCIEEEMDEDQGTYNDHLMEIKG